MGRKYQNNYSTTITTASVGTGDLTFDVTTAPNALAAGEYYHLTITDSLTSPTKTEIVKCTAIATNTLTVVRAQEGTTAQTWNANDFIELRLTAEGLEKLDGPEIVKYSETIDLAAAAVMDRSKGGIQHITLTANATLDVSSLAAGQSVHVCVTGGNTWTLSYLGIDEWSGLTAPPTLKTRHRLEILNDGIKTVAWDAGGND